VLLFGVGNAFALDTPEVSKPLKDVLPPAKWHQVEDSVDRALAWVASQQESDGSFPSDISGQPAVTSLCVMAFLSRGHQPGVGPYGQLINRAIDYAITCQWTDGLLCKGEPGPIFQPDQPSHTATYNHAITGLMLGEVYGQVTGHRAKDVQQSIRRALAYTRQLQLRPKSSADQGGWRYITAGAGSDIAVTSWHLMFLRSAKNAEFDVPKNWIDDAVTYVGRVWNPQTGMFEYAMAEESTAQGSRGVVAAGIISLSMAGQHQSPQVQAAAEWLLAHPVHSYNEKIGTLAKFIFDTYYCSQAAAQLGGRYWAGIYPPLVEILLGAQSPDGHWEPEADMMVYGNACTTAMAVLSLTPAYQLLPVYQR